MPLRTGGEALPPEVRQRLAVDPVFQVTTADGQHWIDPYTGKAVPASLGREQAAMEYLADSGVYKGRATLPLAHLEVERWRHDLLRLLPYEPRLRIFVKDGGWVNPYNGDVSVGIAPEDGRITARVVMAMARQLASCPQAQTGAMMTLEQLAALTGRSSEGAHHMTGTGTLVSEGRHHQVVRAPIAQPARIPVASPPIAQPASAQPTIVPATMPAPPIAIPASLPAATALIPRNPPVADPPQADGRTAELRRAGRVQDHMFADLPDLPGYAIAVHFQPCDHVSGDFYETIKLGDGRMLVAVGDVSGHGLQAALVVATALKTLRIIARSTTDLVELLARFNDEIRHDVMPGQFLTMSAVLLDADSGEAEIVRAGHHHVLLERPGSRTPLRLVGDSGMAVAIASGLGFRTALRTETVVLEPGDTLWQWTDGIDEARNPAGIQFGVNRFYASLVESWDQPLAERIDLMTRRITDWSAGDLADDVTVVAIAAKPRDDGAKPIGDAG